MMVNLIQHQSDKFISFVERFTESRYWKIKLTFLAFFFSLFFTFPSFDAYHKYDDRWQHIMNQSVNPLKKVEHEEGSHAEKLAFRLTPPLIIKALHLHKTGAIVLQYVALFAFLFILTYKGSTLIEDKVSLVFVVLAFSFSFICSVLVSDSRAIFDILAFLFLLLALLSNRFIPIFFFQLLASFTDERALIASSLIIIYFQLRKANPIDLSIKQLITPTIQTTAVVVSWVFYFAIRFYLQTAYGLETGTDRVIDIKEHFPILFAGLWTGLEGLWVVIGVSMVYLAFKKNYLILMAWLSCILILTVVAIGVIDTTRSIAYIFPAFFIGYLILKNNEEVKNLRYITLITLLLCLVPTYYVGGSDFIWNFHSFPMRLMSYLVS